MAKDMRCKARVMDDPDLVGCGKVTDASGKSYGFVDMMDLSQLMINKTKVLLPPSAPAPAAPANAQPAPCRAAPLLSPCCAHGRAHRQMPPPPAAPLLSPLHTAMHTAVHTAVRCRSSSGSRPTTRARLPCGSAKSPTRKASGTTPRCGLVDTCQQLGDALEHLSATTALRCLVLPFTALRARGQ